MLSVCTRVCVCVCGVSWVSYISWCLGVSYIQTHKRLEWNAFFFSQTMQDDVQIFHEFHVHQANEHTSTTFKMVMSEKTNK